VIAAARIGKLHISISHCRSFAVAYVVAESGG
jgi:phosphopantetheinyl transferase (holo-ACP synthase)